jgi:HTH-type transcriptional regulator, glycine betaine synthesis regulator
MNQKLQQTRDQFVEKMGFLGTLFGFSKLIGQIYATLYLSPAPLSLNTLTQELRVSKGSISTNIRELEKWGGCKKVWVKGEGRKDYYEAEVNFRNIVNKRLMDAIKRRISMIGEISESAKAPIEDNGKDMNQDEKDLLVFYKKQIDKMNGVRKKLELLINTVSKFI